MAEKSTFDGSEGKVIDPKVAAQWTKNFRKNNPKKHIAYFFGKDILLELLAQQGAMGIRFYMSDKGDGSFTPVICAADANMNDIAPTILNVNSGEGNGGGKVGDDAIPCPDSCSGNGSILSND